MGIPGRFAVFVFLIFPTVAFASNRITGEFAGCVTRDDLDQFIQAVATKNDGQIKAMLASECAPVKGREYTMLEQDGDASKIRIYTPNGGTVDLFVPAAATE